MSDEVVMMRRCIRLAVEARGRGDVPVGCVVSRGGEIVAEASELIPASTHDVSAHAEVLCVRRACESLATSDLSDCTLVTTAEPCWLCAYAIRSAKIGRVVVGSTTPHVGALTSKYPVLNDSSIPAWGRPPSVVTGVLESECAALRRESRT